MKGLIESVLLALVIVAGLLIPFPEPWAQSVRDRVLEDVLVAETPDAWEVHVGLSFPARYQRHFPLEQGTEVRVAMQPLAVSDVDREELTRRESVRPPAGRALGLDEVIWEGDIPEGPYVTLVFSRPVTFWVRQGKDFRSLVVTVPKGPPPGPEAPPAP